MSQHGSVSGFLPGAASLIEQLDKRLLVILRDGRHLVGVLRSFDQFSNMVMEETSERRILKSKACFADVPLGLYIVRGDNMVLLWEVDDSMMGGLLKIESLEEFAEMEANVDQEVEKKLATDWDFDTDLI